MNQPNASVQTKALVDNLSKALATKAELIEKLEEATATIKTIRAALQGVQIGQALEREVIAEREANEQKAADRSAEG